MEMDDELRAALRHLALLLEGETIPLAEAHRDDLASTVEDLEEDEDWEGTTDQERFNTALMYLEDAVLYLWDAACALTDAAEAA